MRMALDAARNLVGGARQPRQRLVDPVPDGDQGHAERFRDDLGASEAASSFRAMVISRITCRICRAVMACTVTSLPQRLPFGLPACPGLVRSPHGARKLACLAVRTARGR